MGQRGSVPERRETLLGHRSKSHLAGEDVSRAPSDPIEWYPEDPEWHDIAKMLYRAAQKSGQRAFYQQTDVALLYMLCDDVSYYKSANRRSVGLAQVVWGATGGLLLSEGDRRRVRIELDRIEEDDDVAAQAEAFYASLGLAQ